MIAQQVKFCSAYDGVQIAYATSGSGPPLVKAPHWMSHLQHDFASPLWGHMLSALSSQNTVIRYDQRATGLSDREVSNISFDAWVRDFEAVVDAAGLDTFPIIGTSQGASIAIAYAAKHPERVEKLILYSGYARGRLMRGAGQPLAEESEIYARMAELGWDRIDSAFRQFFATQFLPGGTPQQHKSFNELSLLSVTGKVAGQMIRTFDRINVSDLLPQIDCPTLVLHAVGDMRVPFDEGRLLATGIPNAQFVALESQFHLLTAEDKAWPVWLEATNQFLGTKKKTVPAEELFQRLTTRESQLLLLIARGRDNAQIAAVLNLSEKTVRNHITSIFSKLEVVTRSQAIVLARNAGIGLDTSYS
jgi:pimeloyl-ACP methyl ester carboxylesterase/DNA-binding CsgD family transcriptional regulator